MVKLDLLIGNMLQMEPALYVCKPGLRPGRPESRQLEVPGWLLSGDLIIR
jgi:hypothetical protein